MGAADFHAGKAQEITGIKVVDDYTIEARLADATGAERALDAVAAAVTGR